MTNQKANPVFFFFFKHSRVELKAHLKTTHVPMTFVLDLIDVPISYYFCLRDQFRGHTSDENHSKKHVQ